MEFSSPQYWNGLPFPSPGDLPNPGIKPRSPALQGDSLPAEPQGKHLSVLNLSEINFPFSFYFNWRLITLQYCSGFCHTLTWNRYVCTCVPHPELPHHLTPHPISQSHLSAPALSTLSHAWNLDWQSVSHMIIYRFQCYSLKSSHPHLLSKRLFFTTVPLLLSHM